MKKRPVIRPIGEVLEGLIEDLGIAKKVHEYDAVLAWEAVVGPHIAHVASAETINQGVLVVKVRVSTWRNELNLRKAELLVRLNAGLGSAVVKDIRFR
jgi:predicted nucleic acid-binding Zn ribbon protein